MVPAKHIRWFFVRLRLIIIPPSHRGFTLIELLLVLVLLGSLASGVAILMNPGAQLARSRDTQRKSDLSGLQKALELYYNDNGRYPPANPGGGRIEGIAWGSAWTPYMQHLPIDPTSPTRDYFYVAHPLLNDVGGQQYIIYTSLESPNDQNFCVDATTACPNAAAHGANCGGVCNYGVSSGNIAL